jgi:hypothetical protein
LITLPDTMYIKAAALAFVPVPVLEATKVLGIIRHRRHDVVS